MMHTKVLSFFAAAFLAITAFVAPTPARASPLNPGIAIPVNTTSAQGIFNGTLRVTGFAVQDNALVATGMLTGTVITAGGVSSSVIRTVTMPVQTTKRGPAATAAAIGCGILHLELGPLDLDLLGLVVHLDRVVLDLTAVPGAGNLLGNLLCAVVNLLNAGGPLAQIANILNQILALLGA